MSTGTRLPIGELHAVLDEVLAVDPVYLTTAEKRSASLGLARAEARLQAARLRLLAASADVAEETGDRSAATWLANETREAHGTTARRDSALAAALEARWTHVADALGSRFGQPGAGAGDRHIDGRAAAGPGRTWWPRQRRCW